MDALRGSTLEGADTEGTVGSGSQPEAHSHWPAGELVDPALMQDIDLLADVIASISGFGCHLTPEEVDTVLGVPSTPAGQAPGGRRAT